MKFKVRIPLQYVKPVCIAAVLVGIFAVAAGSWITGQTIHIDGGWVMRP